MKKLYINGSNFILNAMTGYLKSNGLYPIVRIEEDDKGYFIPIYDSLSIYYPGFDSKVLYKNLLAFEKHALYAYNKLNKKYK